MPESAFGHWLKCLREARGLSLRDVAHQSDVDHAYVYRLETGAKEAPSSEVLKRLISALEPSSRDAEILRFLMDHPKTDLGLVEFTRQTPSVTFEEFHMLTTVVNRGARPNYATSLARVRRILKEEEHG